MRVLFSLALLAFAFAAAAAAQESPFVSPYARTLEWNYLRAGGDYAYSTAPSPEACAEACGRDGLCIAWTYRVADRTCRLKAIAPAPVAMEGAVSGLSARAPAFAPRAPAPVRAPEPTPTTPAAPPPSPSPERQSDPAAPDVNAPISLWPPADGAAEVDLLGAPTPEAENN